MGTNINNLVLLEILTGYRLTKHAQKRLMERFGTTNRKRIQDLIMNYKVAYWNTDNSINIAIDDYHYFVFKKEPTGWLMITYKEPSRNHISIQTKQKLAQLGVSRKNK